MIEEVLVELLEPEPIRIRRCLEQLLKLGKNVMVDVGGLRGTWTKRGIVLERYEVIEGATPRELLEEL